MSATMVRDVYSGGDWTKRPWFLEGEDHWFTHLGYPLALRVQAAEGLRHIFPPDVCAELLQQPKNAGLALLLVQPWFPNAVIPVLALGLDAQVARAWRDAQLLRRLRDGDQFPGAAAELSVWANLVRGGLRFEREPKCPSGSRPDFVVYGDHRRFFLEVKTPAASDADELGAELDHAFMLHVIDICEPGWLLRMRPSPAFVDELQTPSGRDRIAERLPEIVAAFVSRARKLREFGYARGVFPVGPDGAVEIADGPEALHGGCSIELIERDPAKRRHPGGSPFS